MSRFLGLAVLVVAVMFSSVTGASAQCSVAHFTEQTGPPTGPSGTCSGSDPTQQINQTRKWTVLVKLGCKLSDWKQSDQGGGVLTGIAHGQCGETGSGTPPVCFGVVDPARDLGFFATDNVQKVATTFYDSSYNSVSHGCNYPASQDVINGYSSQECDGDFCCGTGVVAECQQAQGDFNQSICECNFATPILVDMDGDGFQLTDFADGVLFDLRSDGVRRQISWTARGSDDAFLFLDRNHNGVVDGGTELFGNYTPTPGGTSLNGFVALATLDSNGDGVLDSRDPVYWQLQLWTDRNHDGMSDPSELVSLAQSGIKSISLNYEESRRRDQYGNLFRFRSHVIGTGGPFAFDVSFLLSAPNTPMSRRR